MKRFEGLALIFKALSSEENLRIIFKLNKPKTVKQLNRKLSKMPINRRINILENVGLVERTRGSGITKGYVKLTPFGKKMRSVFVLDEEEAP